MTFKNLKYFNKMYERGMYSDQIAMKTVFKKFVLQSFSICLSIFNERLASHKSNWLPCRHQPLPSRQCTVPYLCETPAFH